MWESFIAFYGTKDIEETHKFYAVSYTHLDVYKRQEYTADEAGFHKTTFPAIAGLVGRLPAMEVKLNGVTANTNPSSGLYSIRFQASFVDSGCSL